MMEIAEAQRPMRRAGAVLAGVQRLPTSGARGVEPFKIDGKQYLAVPQLARDLMDQPAAMTGGDSNVETLVYRWTDGAFAVHQRLPVPGGEDAEFFTIGDRAFLATASLRSGAGPYKMQVKSVVYEWRDGRFEPFQLFDTVAAKQWHHFVVSGRHFLALAQGVKHDGAESINAPSRIYEWDGARFVPFQDVDSTWGYNWLSFKIGAESLLAYADHLRPSVILRWTGTDFEPHQTLEGTSGRAFCFLEHKGNAWLAFACLHGDSWLHRWDGHRFERHQMLSGPGGREFEWMRVGNSGYLVQINFIEGSREAPRPCLTSHVLAWRGTRIEIVDSFRTSGGTDAAAFSIDNKRYLAVSNSLDSTIRFRSESFVYTLDSSALE